MLLHLVHNIQLKKKTLKKLPPLTYLLLDVNGIVYAPVGVNVMSMHVSGMPLATFELQVGKAEQSVLTTAKTFDELLQYFKDQFLPAIAAKDIQKVLRSQSLTITYVIEQLKIPRVDAKEFIERCVNVGAFKKYYSYWVRTDIFSSWMVQHDEK